MEILLYTNKQVFGGFVIIFLVCVLFVANLSLSYGNSNFFTNINMSYFTIPIIFTLSIISIMYVNELNKSIKKTLDKYIRPDNFELTTCPDGFNTINNGREINCEGDCGPGFDIIPSDDDPNAMICGTSAGTSTDNN
jgi:hypothetical protein